MSAYGVLRLMKLLKKRLDRSDDFRVGLYRSEGIMPKNEPSEPLRPMSPRPVRGLVDQYNRDLVQ
jgi:hypothetical protein